MQRQQGGSIINISSVNAHATIQDAEMYAAAKSGVNGMTRGMSISFGPDQIRVNAIAPGFTNTPHYQNWLRTSGDPAGMENRVLKLHPLGKIVESEILHAQIGRKWLLPEFSSMDELNAFVDKSNQKMEEASKQFLHLSNQDDWWIPFMERVRTNSKDS